MSDILIAMLSPAGHVSPLLGVAADLVARGNRVTVMTGGVHAAAVRAVGAELHPLPPIADLDDSQFDSSTRGDTSGIEALNRAIIRMFLVPMRHQVAELSAAMARIRFDAMIVDYGFFGVIPLLLGDPARRPPVLYYTPPPLVTPAKQPRRIL
jgi:UDP:flavonoid glycosyltransferase YjiC (YdhE family)